MCGPRGDRLSAFVVAAGSRPSDPIASVRPCIDGRFDEDRSSAVCLNRGLHAGGRVDRRFGWSPLLPPSHFVLLLVAIFVARSSNAPLLIRC